MRSRSAPAGTQSVLRAVSLLKVLSEHGEEDLATLTHEVGLARTTTHRLLAALESEDLVTRAPSGVYRLGPGLIQLAMHAGRSDQLRTLAHSHLQSLAADSGETATLHVLSNGSVLVVDQVFGRQLVGASHEVGISAPLYATSTGKALLAALKPAERAELLRGRFSRLTPKTVTSKRRLDEHLKLARKRGYATAVDELEVGFTAAGAAILDADGHPLASISIGGPSARLNGKALSRAGAAVRDAAALLSAMLGYG